MQKINKGSQYWENQIKGSLLNKGAFEIFADMQFSVYASLESSAEKFPNKICLIDGTVGIGYTYSEVLKKVNSFAAVLKNEYSVKENSTVGILLYNDLKFLISVYAVNSLGAVVMPLPTKYTKNEILSLISKSQIDGIIFDGYFSQIFTDIDYKFFKINLTNDFNLNCTYNFISKPNIDYLRKPAFLIFTSGTSGKSKGVVLTNQNVMHAIEVYRQIFNITENDKTILAIPGYNVTGLIATLALFVRAGGQIFLKKYFNAKEVLEIVRDNGITFLHGSPTVYKLLLCEKRNFPSLPSLRMFACGSENMPSSKIKELKEWIPSAEFRTVYGLTESSSPATIFPEDASRSKYLGSSGRPVPGLEIKICDDDGNMLSENTVGSIFMRGTNITPGYYKLGTQGFVDGWLDTGDIGYFNEAGYLYIVDRKKDMINRGGEKICSYDIENLINEIHGVKEAAVVGIKDSKYGEVPAAMLATDKNAGLTADMIKDSISKNLAKFQVPVLYEFVKELPKTANMKIDKKAVKKLLEIKTEWRNRNEKT